MIKSFKDQCDKCKKFDYCKGYNNQVLCKSCIEEEKKNKENSIKIEGGLREQGRLIFEIR